MTYVAHGKPVNNFVDTVLMEHAHSRGILVFHFQSLSSRRSGLFLSFTNTVCPIVLQVMHCIVQVFNTVVPNPSMILHFKNLTKTS